MGEGREGLSLQGLAEMMEAQIRRLEALERENEKMRSENAELRDKVANLEGAATRKEKPDGIRQPDEVVEERVSRKALLAKAGAAAVAVAAAGTLLSPREAKAATVEGTGATGVLGTGTVEGATGVQGQLQSGIASGHGVLGFGGGSGYSGVSGQNFDTGGVGVRGQGDTGVRGQGPTGVHGLSTASDSYGVEGEGDTGVHGHTVKYGYSGVYGLHEGKTGYGVYGQGKGIGAGVLGRNSGGAGVEANQSRYGGKFDGNRAPLLLVTKGTKGRPKNGSHTKGEIYLDSAATLFVCTRSGTPGTWRKVTTTSA